MSSLSPEAAAALLPVLLEEMTAGVALHDAALNRGPANARMNAMLGLPARLSAPGTPLAAQLDAMGETLDAAAVEAIRAAFAGPGRTAAAWRSADGRHLELTVLDAPDRQRLAICRDVTAVREADAALAEERARVDHLLQHTRDCVVLFDAAGAILENSDRTGDLLRLPPELVMPGVTHEAILLHMVERGDFGPVDDPQEFVRDRRARIMNAGHVTYPARMPDGIWVEYQFEVLEDGGLLAIVRDITALKATELALANERAMLATIVENLPDGVMLYDADFKWRIANRQLMEFHDLTEEVAYPGADAVDILRFQAQRGDFGPPPETPEALETLVAERAAVMRRPEGSQYLRRTAGGFWIEFNMRPLPDGGLLGFYRDITPLKQREAELEAERTLLREVLDGVDALVVLLDRDANIMVANNSRREMMGTPDEFYRPGTNLADAVRWRYRQGVYGDAQDEETTVRERVANAFSGGVVSYDRKMPSGRWVESIWTPISGGRLVGFSRDITVLKQREAELEAERILLREVLDSSDSLVMVFDADARMLLFNSRFEELMDIPAAFCAPGRSFQDIVRWLARRGDFGPVEDEEALVRDRIARVYSGDLRRYGRLLPNGRWVEFSYRQISGGRLIGHARDITELKQREAELETERTLLREVLDSTDSLVTVFDGDARVLLANSRHEQLLGTPQEYFSPGRTLSEGVRWLARRGDYGPFEDEDALVAERVASIYAGQIQGYARQLPDGRWVEFTYTPISGGRLIGHARDVTPLKASEQAALAAQAEAEAARDAAEAAAHAKSSFLAAMSHEIRTPMNVVIGMLELLDRSDLAADQARSVAVMRESAHSLLRIIDDVLDFSKIDAGRMEIEALPFSLRGLIEGTIETLTPEARRRGIALFADPAGPGPDWLEGDPTRVRQVLFNLVGNALKFTERGFVRIAAETRLEAGGALVSLTIEDSGVGMDAPTLGRLFQPFTQADSSTTRRFGGTGLGLSIVRRLAELMGGEVHAESTPGRGSRFLVTLRLGVATPPVAARPIAAPAQAPTGGAPLLGQVLVVDDHPVNREVITRQLELLGVAATTADDGARGLAAWRRDRPAVVLLDIHMPVMDGFELARAIRGEEARGQLARTMLIAVTANALKGEAERCYAAGMDGFLTKPVTLDGLSRVLGRFMPGLGRDGVPSGGALFDPEALRGLFGQDRERLLGILDSFAEQAAHDIARLHAASGLPLAEAAHRLKGSARMVGARLLAEAAQAMEQAAREGDTAGVDSARGQLAGLLAETLAVARPALGGA
ncbi:MAG: hypothetical protein JWR10_4307 [Rubritepida sp.]|nr:hypothetical protein [Rubritepida sp.]